MFNAKLAFALAASFIVSGGVSDVRPNISAQSMNGGQCPTHTSGVDCPMNANGEYCPMHDDKASVKDEHAEHIVSATAQAQGPLRPDGSRDSDSHRYSAGDGCSRLNKRAPNAKLNGVKANTVACTCVKKCSQGTVQEDMSKDKNNVYVCRNACHRDRCFCPDPCKS